MWTIFSVVRSIVFELSDFSATSWPNKLLFMTYWCVHCTKQTHEVERLNTSSLKQRCTDRRTCRSTRTHYFNSEPTSIWYCTYIAASTGRCNILPDAILNYFPFHRVIRDWITGCNPIFVNYFQLRKFLSIVYDLYVC